MFHLSRDTSFSVAHIFNDSKTSIFIFQEAFHPNMIKFRVKSCTLSRPNLFRWKPKGFPDQFPSAPQPCSIMIRPCQVCEEALEDVFAWLAGGGEVAVFDATNTTRLALLLIYTLLLLG